MSTRFLRALFLQFSGTVGAGIFSLPYALYSSNFYLASFFLLIIALIVAIVNQFYLDIITRTPGDHQLPGYARIYLGPKFRSLALLNIFVLIIGALMAYLSLAPRFIGSIFTSLDPLTASLVFIALLLIFFLADLPFVKILHSIIPILIIFIPLLFLTTAFSLPYRPIEITPFSFIFIGSALFSLSSFTIVPEVEETMRSDPKQLRLASLLGTVLALLVYLIFSFSILKITDGHISPDTISSIAPLSHTLGFILSCLGFLAIFNASLNFLLVLKETLFRDLCFSKTLSYSLSALIPVILLFTSKVSFFEIISLTGTITVFVSVLLILLIRIHLPHTQRQKQLISLILTFFFAVLVLEFI